MSDAAGSPLGDAVRDFVDEVAPDVVALARTVEGLDAGRLRADVEVEAFNLACAFVDADGLHTDDELWALAATFGHRLPSGLGRATPADIRAAGLVVGRRAHLDRPSTLVDLLAEADARDGGVRAERFARHGAQIGQAVAALDLLPSRTELNAIERFRATVRQAGHAARSRVAAAPGLAGAPAAAGGAPAAPPAEQELPPPRPLPDLLAELDGLVGLAGVKREVHLVSNLLRVQQIRRDRGLPVLDQSRHLVFTGNPGTGKTTVARLLAQIYRTLGVVERGHLVETDRAGLVAGFVGQTAGRVVAAFDRAEGGVLLVDEAYSLARGGENDFGREAIDTLVKLVEDRRERLVVILAGYPEEMAELVAANPGMRSRFPKTIHFPDYDDDDLVAIVEALGAEGHYRLDRDARAAVRAWFAAQPRDRGFGNGRLARNLFEAAVTNQASRLVAEESPTDEQLTTLTAADIPPLDGSALVGSVERQGEQDLRDAEQQHPDAEQKAEGEDGGAGPDQGDDAGDDAHHAGEQQPAPPLDP
jgi:AAA lid domain/ATPase family associated with various cellular activities (AAA)